MDDFVGLDQEEPVVDLDGQLLPARLPVGQHLQQGLEIGLPLDLFGREPLADPLDRQGQPFRLDAGSAVQQSSAEPIVQLRSLSAEIKLPEGPASIKADQGRYDLEKEQVAVEGPIKFRTSDGYTLDTHDATVDLKTRRMQSGGAVTGTTPMGVFSGNKLTADLERRTVAIDGNARLRIVPGKANRR